MRKIIRLTKEQINEINNDLVNTGQANIFKVGVIEVVKKPQVEMFIPATQKKQLVPERSKLVFRASKYLKDLFKVKA